jgi:hypothetical protein
MAYDFRLYAAGNQKLDATIKSLGNEQKIIYNSTVQFIREANKVAKITCDRKCNQYASISQERKSCDGECLEEFEKRVFGST